MASVAACGEVTARRGISPVERRHDGCRPVVRHDKLVSMISCLPTIAKAVQQIRAGELTAAELVEFCLSRIERYEPSLAAWESVDRDGARHAAAQLDHQAREGQFAGPLHGIPIGIKDIIDVQGWPTKAGSPTRADHVAEADATLVGRLRQAGAIILGKTVTTEFACFDPARTRNPWNLQHTPGGSSSGSAAAVAMQMCMAAIGTQTGGSIIRPASYCGVCGLKPTLGQIPLDGVVPISGHLDHAGPIARSVQDAARVFFAMVAPAALEAMWRRRQGSAGFDTGTDDASEVTQSSLDWMLFEQPQTVSSWPIDLRPLAGYFEDAASVAVWKSFQAAIKQIASANRCELPGPGRAESPIPLAPQPEFRMLPPLPLPASFESVHDRHRRIMAVDAAAVHRDVFAQRPGDFGPHISTLINAGLTELAVDYVEALAYRARFRDDICELLGNDSLAITPATTMVAPTLETTGDPAFNSPWSYAGLPAITITCGVDAEGMPCGLQIIGPPDSELRVLRAAQLCEQALAFQQTPHLPDA